MADLLEYITKAEKRIWIILRENILWGIRECIDEALKKTFEGVDVRIITSDMENLTRLIETFEAVNKTTVRNLGVVEAPVLDVIYIIDDKAWARIDGRWTEIGVKEAEGKFKEFWNKYRMKTLVSEAEKRVLAAIPRVNKDDAHALIEKAASGVDIYVITNDKSIFTSTIERLVRDNDRRLARVTRFVKFKPLIVAASVLTFVALMGLPLLASKVASPIYAVFFGDNKILEFLLTAFYMFVGALSAFAFVSYVTRLNNVITAELKDAKRAVERVKKASKHLNVLKAPITEEFYVVDDRAWVVREDGRQIEIDVKDAEKEFARLWRMYEGPWVLGKDVK